MVTDVVRVEDALNYLQRREGWEKLLVVGGGLLVVSGLFTIASLRLFGPLLESFVAVLIYPVALLIALPVGGYHIRVYRSTVNGSDTPPDFTDWRELYRDGAYALLISAAYLAVPVAAATMFFLVFGLYNMSTIDSGQTGFMDILSGASLGLGAASVALLIVALVAWLVFSYLLTIALINYARQGELEAAFDFTEIHRISSSSEFLGGWLVGFVVFGAAATVTDLVFGVIPYIGFVVLALFVMPFITFYVTVASNRLFAVAYRDALESRGA